MNIEAAIASIHEAMAAAKSWFTVHAYLQSALAALQPQRYVMSGAANTIYILDTQHPDYRPTDTLSIHDPWVVVSWSCPSQAEREKARAVVELLNSTATPHDTQT